MKTINFNLSININQPNPPVDGCFGIYYQLITTKRCVEDPYVEDAFGDAPEWGDVVNDVNVMQEGFLGCITFTQSDTVLSYGGTIQYNDNNPLTHLSCRTYIKFYVLPCCVNNYDCNTIPVTIDNHVATNSTHFFIDVSSQVNKTICRRYMIAFNSMGSYNFPLSVTYTTCGATNKVLCPTVQGGPENTAAYTVQGELIGGIGSSFVTPGPIPADNSDNVIEICSYSTPVVTDSTATVINNVSFIIEDINEHKENITGDCCAKCVAYRVQNNSTAGLGYSYQRCNGTYSFMNNVAPGQTTACFNAVQGTVRVHTINPADFTLLVMGKPDSQLYGTMGPCSGGGTP